MRIRILGGLLGASLCLLGASLWGCNAGGTMHTPSTVTKDASGKMVTMPAPTTMPTTTPQHDAAAHVPPPSDPCIAAHNCAPGVWVNVTPPDVDLVNGSCSNYGTETVAVDPVRTQDVYTLFMCQGIWKSTDFGQTWTGPINTGKDGTTMGDCAGGVTIPPNSTASPPILYVSCIRGAGTGFWRSTNGGLDWTSYMVTPGGARQDFYPSAVDPYDDQHLLMAGHEMNVLVQSSNGGQTWTAVKTDAGMQENGGTAFIQFIDTGNATTTRDTWLWMAQVTGGTIGTWRTTNGGASWTHVDANEHVHGSSQIYQPDNKGVVYMAGAYADSGWGALRSADYGATWMHVGQAQAETVIFGTSRFVYCMHGGAAGAGEMVDPMLELSPQPGIGSWTSPGTPAAMTQGPAQVAVTNNGMYNVVLAANWNAGMWRYVEPSQ